MYNHVNDMSNYKFYLKYQRFTPSGCKDVRIRKFEFVTKTEFITCISVGLSSHFIL